VSTFIRKVVTKSGATAVQIVRKESGRIVALKHLGSAHTPERLTLLLETARKQLLGGQLPLFTPHLESVPVLSLSAASLFLFQALQTVYRYLQFDQLHDPTFEQLVLARLIEPASKRDTIRILRELALKPPSYTSIYRCLQRVIDQDYRSQLARLCFQASKPQNLSLLLYDVTTLYFETQKEDDYRKSGLSKERRLEPQIVVGLLVDRSGFPLEIHEFEGNLSEKKTIIPVITAFCQRHRLDTHHLTITADAGMLSAPNLSEMERAGFSFIVGSRIAKTPYQIKEWQKTSLEVKLPDGQIFDTYQTFGYRKVDKVRRRVIYQYKQKRAELDLVNLEKQLVKAQRILSGQAPLRKNSFLTLTQAKPTLNLALIHEHRLRAGIKGYVTNLPAPEEDPKGVPAQEIIAAYHQLFQVEKSFRMSKSDLKARPIFHHKLDSIRAHLTIVFAALAMVRFIEDRSQLSIKRFVQTLRPIRTPTLLINGVETQIDPLIPKEVQSVVDRLSKDGPNGH
jgi:hypothetical protein